MLSSWSFGKFGDGLQDVLEAAPYYLLGQDTVPVDVLQLLPASVNVTTNTAQGVFQSANHTTSTALITLVGNPGQNVGVSIVMITSVAGVPDLQNTTQALLGSMSLFPPQISTTNSTLSWFQYLAGNTLSVTSLAPRPMNSHFIAAADGSCQAVVQGQVQRQGQWSVAGKCLVETTPDGNKFHALQLEATSGNVYFGSQKWVLAPNASQADSSPCTFTQPDGTVVPPPPCSTACTNPDGTPAPYTTPCILGADPNITCTACGSVLGNLPFTDTAALPDTTGTANVLTCSGNCSEVAYLYMVQGLPATLCNETCMANEAAWAQAELQQPPTPAACNSACQMQHDSFLLQIQRADSTTPGSILPGRKLLDANDVIQQDGTPCADVVRDDLPSTRITGYDCTTCDNSASAQYAAASGGDGSSPSPDYGSIISNVLRISIALLA
ncbi:hypothetical protein ABBQ32_013481 [Trebouxia sp. C0010 RCD-2024]